MSKKKQLAGKKTKLAKLPLTRVLAQQLSEELPPGPSPGTAEPVGRQLPLSWEQLEEGRASPLIAAYLQIVQDLLTLQADLPASVGVSASTAEPRIPADLPSSRKLQKVLRQARSELKDLHRLLSA
ncbi:MAG: hypothetical protein AB1491_12315 [Thermodesulfobacteriota bacterium]